MSATSPYVAAKWTIIIEGAVKESQNPLRCAAPDVELIAGLARQRLYGFPMNRKVRFLNSRIKHGRTILRAHMLSIVPIITDTVVGHTD
jgi:hypothetical protein